MYSRLATLRGAPWVVATFGVTFAYLLVRCFVGVDLNDGAYVLAIARRMAAGDRPFVDEMSAHTLGSMFAVPFVWLWTSLFGSTALIAASRVFAVLWMATTSVISYRALSASLPPLPSAVALCVTAVSLPYSIIATSYNTVSMFALVLATCAAYRTITDYDPRWARTTAVSATVATIAFPAVLAGAGALLVVTVIICRRSIAWRRLLLDIAMPWAVLSLLVGVALLGVCGASAVQAALQAQSHMRPAIDVSGLVGFAKFELAYLTTPGKLPLVALLGLVSIATVRWRLISWASAIAALLLLLSFAVKHPSANSIALDGGTFSAAFGLLSALLCLPFALRTGWINERLRTLLLLSLCSLLSAAGVQLVTASGYTFGAAMDGAGPIVLAIVLGTAMHLADITPRRFAAPVVVLPLVTALACLNSVVFNEGPTMQPRWLISTGPAAGLWVSDSSRHALAQVETLTHACPAQSRLFAVSLPGAYLWQPPRSAATVSWLGTDVLHSFPLQEQLKRRADCIVAVADSTFRGLRAQDATAQRRLLQGYRPVTPPLVVSTDPVHGDQVFQTWVRSPG